MERVFIPSKISDNHLLYQNDPYYVARLRQTGSEALVRAWLEGDWDLVDGAFFDCWDAEKHVLPARQWLPRIPEYSFRVRAFDWGYGRPFSVGWYAVSDGSWGLPREALVKYREWYGTTGKPNEGLRMTADLVAKGIREREKHIIRDTPVYENINVAVADPSIFIRDGGPSIAETMTMAGTQWRRADNSRIAGWAEMRRRLVGVGGMPLLYFLDCCDDSIRTIPTLQIDETKPEDLDTESEDHAADECRYGCMSRPWVSTAPEEDALVFPKLPSEYTINALMERQRELRLAAEEDY